MKISLFPNGCPVCKKETETTHHCYFEGYEYVKCQNCDLIYQIGETTTEDMSDCYSGGFLKSARRSLLNRFRKIENQRDFDIRMKRAREIFGYAQKQANVDKGVYLDIGCNKGFNIYAAEEMGWEGHGNELIEEILVPIKNSKPHLKDRLKQGSFLDLASQYQSNSFDLITCIDVIEHLPDPDMGIKEIKRLLKPNGVAIFQTPEATDENIALKEDWKALKANEHLLLFNKANFETFAKDAGFDTISFAPEPFEVCDGNFVATCSLS